MPLVHYSTSSKGMLMQYTPITVTIQNYLRSLWSNQPRLKAIITKIQQEKGVPFLVGGVVRDLVLSIPVKDIDIEVHNLSLQHLEKILAQFGPVSLVGKAFGVFRVHGLDIDWSIPRRDSAGRHPEVVFDPSMTLEEAFRRRDLTMNAMGINLITSELVDPFHGLKDLHDKILRTPDVHLFVQDPLRFFRVMQFVARFEMFPDDALQKLCATMDIGGVAKERIAAEFDKVILKAHKPSLAIVWLDSLGRLAEILPEIAATKNVPQEPSWHPEGDVFEHTKQAFDAAAHLTYETDNERRIIIWASLCHDLGKITTTRYFDGAYRCHGHDVEGARMTKPLLERIVLSQDIIEAACLLVRYHMVPWQLVIDNATPAAYKRLATKLAPHTSMEMLAKLAIADGRAKNPARGAPTTQDIPELDLFLQRAQEAHVLYNQEKPVLQGRDLLDIMPPGPEMGKVLKRAYEIQIDEGITDKEELKRRVLDKKYPI
jgi:tRNA nucleotidyltransferase (CCA-adding enzyme)